MPRIDNENDKMPWIFQFLKPFYACSPKILTDFVDWNDEKGQQVTIVLSSMLKEEINAVLQM